MHYLARHRKRVLLVGMSLLGLCIVSPQSLAQSQVLNGKDEVTLTPAQQAVVDKITRSAGTVNVGVLKKINTTGGGSPENRYAQLVLPLGNGKDKPESELS
jgi:hypothetical protein